MKDLDLTDYQKVMARVHKVGDCLVVTSNSSNGDLNMRCSDGKVRRAHAVVFETKAGRPPRMGYFLMRNCQTPGCVRYEHLDEVDVAERERRKKAKLEALTEVERAARAALREQVKEDGLTRKEVLAIYDDPRSQRVIAKEYGCNPATVHKIKVGKIHSHTTGHIPVGYDGPLPDRRFKVSDEDVIKIRDDTRPYRKIAEEYGISHVMVGRIKNFINRLDAKLGN